MPPLIIQDVPIHCINEAAITYQVPATMIVAVLKTEGGRNGTASKNKNGSTDYGPMQINSCWVEKLTKYGITKTDLQYNPCINVAVGTWILAQSIATGKNIWHGAGIYHSHTGKYNEKYSTKVRNYHDWITKTINIPKTETGPKV